MERPGDPSREEREEDGRNRWGPRREQRRERGAGSTLNEDGIEEGILTFLEVRATRAEIQKLRRRLQAAIGGAREEGKSSSPRDQRYRLTIAFYPLETGGADATRPPPAKKRTAKKPRGALTP